MRPMRFAAWLVLFATLLLWSGNWMVARAVRDDIAPGIATVGRLLVVLAVLLPFSFYGLSRKLKIFEGLACPLLDALAPPGGGVPPALKCPGPHSPTATSGILSLSTTPIFILLLAMTLGERARGRQWLG